ncbi:hypothetical protein Tco_0450967 [Tanacetum coccineum]
MIVCPAGANPIDGGVGYDDDGDGEVAVMVVLAAVGQQPERRGREKRECGGGMVRGCHGWLPERGGWRVAASKLVDRIDPVTRSLFGVGQKTLPEKFSGGGWPEKVAVAGGDRVAGGGGGWREGREL